MKALKQTSGNPLPKQYEALLEDYILYLLTAGTHALGIVHENDPLAIIEVTHGKIKITVEKIC